MLLALLCSIYVHTAADSADECALPAALDFDVGGCVYAVRGDANLAHAIRQRKEPQGGGSRCREHPRRSHRKCRGAHGVYDGGTANRHAPERVIDAQVEGQTGTTS